MVSRSKSQRKYLFFVDGHLSGHFMSEDGTGKAKFKSLAALPSRAEEILSMIHDLNDIEKLKIVRPVFGSVSKDRFHLPVIKRLDENLIDWNNLSVTGVGNLKPGQNDAVAALMFRHDTNLQRYWNEPLKYVPLFQSCAFVSTPDYSLSPTMNPHEFDHNVFMSRWLGNLWQYYGCRVAVALQWCTPDTYDLYFSAIEQNSVVIVSTLGCKDNQKIFMDGFKEMKKRLMPSLIIVYGDMLPGMTGRFLQVKYSDAFAKKSIQLTIPGFSPIFEIKEIA